MKISPRILHSPGIQNATIRLARAAFYKLEQKKLGVADFDKFLQKHSNIVDILVTETQLFSVSSNKQHFAEDD
jgi:hypothetical protein